MTRCWYLSLLFGALAVAGCGSSKHSSVVSVVTAPTPTATSTAATGPTATAKTPGGTGGSIAPGTTSNTTAPAPHTTTSPALPHPTSPKAKPKPAKPSAAALPAVPVNKRFPAELTAKVVKACQTSGGSHGQCECVVVHQELRNVEQGQAVAETLAFLDVLKGGLTKRTVTFQQAMSGAVALPRGVRTSLAACRSA
jgi:hypothetical protein